MLATLDFESLVEDVYGENLTSFVIDKSKTSADAYLASANVLMQTQIVDAKKAESYWKALNKNWFSFIPEMTSGTKFEYWIDNSVSFRELIERKQEVFNESWKMMLQNEYPDIYNYHVASDTLWGAADKKVTVKIVSNSDVYCYDNNVVVASVVNGIIHANSNIAAYISGSDITFIFSNDENYAISVVGRGTDRIGVQVSDYTGDNVKVTNYIDVETNIGEEISIADVVSNSYGDIISPNYDSQTSVKNISLTIENGYIHSTDEIIENASVAEGEMITISAYVPSGKEFLGWTSNIGTDIFEDPTSVTTTVTIPDSDVIVTAIVNALPEHIHTIVEDAYAASTCVGYGHTEGTHCEECGEVLSGNELIPQTGEHIDNNPDGACDICGYIIDGIASLFSRSLSLSGNIAVNFYMEMNAELSEAELSNVSMKFTLDDGTEMSMPYSEAATKTVNGITYKVFSCEVYSTQMAQNITATMCMGDTEGTSYTYSVKDYIDNMYNDEAEPSDKLNNVLASMKNYGAAAQIYFNKNTDDLVSKLGTLPDIGDLSAFESKYTIFDDTAGIALRGSSLVLYSETSIKVYFITSSGTTLNDYDITVTNSNGNAVNFIVNEKSGYIEIPNISAIMLDELFTITAGKDGVEALSFKYGAFSYIFNKINDPDENLVNVVKALYAYNQAAENYVK